MPLRLVAALLLGALALAACSGVKVRQDEVITERTRYRFGDPGPDWRRVSLGDVDVAWVRDSSAHTLSVNSMCQNYQEAPLTALRRQQLVGFTQAERVEEREEMVDGRAALFSRWRARLDGVPVELGLWTLKKDGCIYDFTYTSPLGAYDEQSQALARLLQGFATERVEVTAPDGEYSSEESDRESLGAIVGQELESLIPFTAKLRAGMEQMGGMFVLGARALARGLQPPSSLAAVVYQVESLGARSVAIGTLTAAFAGLVIAIQFGFFLARFGVQHTVGKVVVLTLFRELAPVLTALTVGARIGSGIAAELGSMTVTEQVDAVRALGADPIKKLVVPRVYACLVVMPMLTVLADVTGFIAGAAVTKFEYDISFAQFFSSALETVDEADFLSGVGKSVVFGLIIAVVGCYKGFHVEGGTEGVGRATTQTVAVASVAVLLADFFLTKLLLTIT